MTGRRVKLTIENAAPYGPARTVTIDGHSYSVESYQTADEAMTETYDLVTEDETPANITVNVHGSSMSEKTLIEAVQRAIRWGRS